MRGQRKDGDLLLSLFGIGYYVLIPYSYAICIIWPLQWWTSQQFNYSQVLNRISSPASHVYKLLFIYTASSSQVPLVIHIYNCYSVVLPLQIKSPLLLSFLSLMVGIFVFPLSPSILPYISSFYNCFSVVLTLKESQIFLLSSPLC